MKSINLEKNLNNKKVLVRVDWNVIFKNGKVLDESRIVHTIPTIKYLLKKGAYVILCTHLGRPQGKKINSFSLKELTQFVSKKYSLDITFLSDSIITHTQKIKDTIENSQKKIFLLENIRFYKKELENTKDFSEKLASLADYYVNDAFSVSHRNHASVTGVTDFLPSYVGLLFEKEFHALTSAQKKKKHSVAIIGGAKLETKLNLVNHLVDDYKHILLGTILAYAVKNSEGKTFGKINQDVTKKDCETILKTYKKNQKKIILPVDYIVQDKDKNIVLKKESEVLNTDYLYDIGPLTIVIYSEYIKSADYLLWNGPLGWFENPPFCHGTKAIAQLFAMRAKGKAYGIAGGGETIAAIHTQGVEDYIDYISLSGGAMIEFLIKGTLPGITALQKK